LNKEINRYIENKDFKSAKNLANTLGPLIEGFDIAKAIEKINDAEMR